MVYVLKSTLDPDPELHVECPIMWQEEEEIITSLVSMREMCRAAENTYQPNKLPNSTELWSDDLYHIWEFKDIWKVTPCVHSTIWSQKSVKRWYFSLFENERDETVNFMLGRVESHVMFSIFVIWDMCMIDVLCCTLVGKKRSILWYPLKQL